MGRAFERLRKVSRLEIVGRPEVRRGSTATVHECDAGVRSRGVRNGAKGASGRSSGVEKLKYGLRDS